jgi:hypothetical protein
MNKTTPAPKSNLKTEHKKAEIKKADVKHEAKKVSKPKRKKTTNVYDLIQFKKMLGKNMIKPHGIILDRKGTLELNQKIREKILLGQIRNVSMRGYVNNGILFIIDVDKLLIVDSISYSDIKNTEIDFDIYVEQYGKLNKLEIASLIND